MLHIHNGDCSADTARQSSLAGEHFAWRESLITGPTPSGLSDNEWRRIRSKHLSEAYGVDVKECERGLSSQEETLASFAQHEEVVLWFELDLFCQVHLIYLLNWFSQHDLGKICGAGMNRPEGSCLAQANARGQDYCARAHQRNSLKKGVSSDGSIRLPHLNV
jgi:hypothetical protein